MVEPRCRHCDAALTDVPLGLLRLEEEAVETQVERRGLVVCPSCDRVLGGVSEYQRTDLDQMDAETWQRVRSYDDI